MKRTYIPLFLILLTISAPVYAQRKTPEHLSEAAYCLVSGKHDWLGSARSEKAGLALGFWSESKSYRHEKHLIVVSFTGAHEGHIFDFHIEQHHGRKILNIENDAEFVHPSTGIQFVRPPLGGAWANVHLELAIKRIERAQKFSIPVEQLSDQNTEIVCSSYFENRSLLQ